MEGAETYSGINAYCYGVAQYVLQEERRRPQGDELPDEIPVKEVRAPNRLGRTEQTILVRQLLSKLSEEERSLLTRYFSEDRAELAAELGVSPNSLRIRIHRIISRLEPRSAAATMA